MPEFRHRSIGAGFRPQRKALRVLFVCARNNFGNKKTHRSALRLPRLHPRRASAINKLGWPHGVRGVAALGSPAPALGAGDVLRYAIAAGDIVGELGHKAIHARAPMQKRAIAKKQLPNTAAITFTTSSGRSDTPNHQNREPMTNDQKAISDIMLAPWRGWRRRTHSHHAHALGHGDRSFHPIACLLPPPRPRTPLRTPRARAP